MPTILVIDDNADLQLAFKKVLTEAGYKVRIAGNGEEGLRKARERVPDLILLDMLMPKLGGPDVLRALKESRLTDKIPVIAMSSLPQKNEAKLKAEGAVAYIEKSRLDDFSLLLHAVGSWLLADSDFTKST